MAIWASWRQKRPWWGRICSSPHAQNRVLMSFTLTLRSRPGLAADTATCASRILSASASKSSGWRGQDLNSKTV